MNYGFANGVARARDFPTLRASTIRYCYRYPNPNLMNPSKRSPLALRGLMLAQLCWLALPAAAQTTPAAPAEKEKEKDVLVLSPFEVVADNNGYYSANTMSGTRFNTKLDD